MSFSSAIQRDGLRAARGVVGERKCGGLHARGGGGEGHLKGALVARRHRAAIVKGDNVLRVAGSRVGEVNVSVAGIINPQRGNHTGAHVHRAEGENPGVETQRLRYGDARSHQVDDVGRAWCVVREGESRGPIARGAGCEFNLRVLPVLEMVTACAAEVVLRSWPG